LFALSGTEAKSGREDAAFEDTKYVSKQAENFLAGILDGIADGELVAFPNRFET
jgi:glutamine synthetase